MQSLWWRLVVLAVLAGAAPAFAQTPASGTAPASARQPAAGDRKRAVAVRVPAGSIRLDGRLDEDAWRQVPVLSTFVQKEPVEGAAPTEPMEVRFAYDDAALYIGAYMHSGKGMPVQAPMGRRDSGEQAEHLQVSLDTWLDRRTAYTFGVTASGVRLDYYHASDTELDPQAEFDPVWEARTTIDDEGWSAELWIPFSQLRFNDRSPQVWGLNVKRWVPSRNEEVYWALVPRTDQGWASRFGDLLGLDDIVPSRRIEVLPYLAGTARTSGRGDPENPFDAGNDLGGGAGLDFRMGLGSNLTLEATVNPDFGQVEADPAEVNLSAFETFFTERRPFFVEGSQLLSGPVNNYFYSRRIGAPPSGRVAADFVDYPRTTTILGAAKIVGRLPSQTSVGVLGAVTGEESARTYGPGLDRFGRVRVVPRTMYVVGRMQQQFGAAASTAGLMVTAVHRHLSDDDPLAASLTRNAFSISGDSLLRFRDGEYELSSHLGLTYVDGDPRAIDRIQRSSAHYFQRPDAGYVTYDPSRSRMVGSKGLLGIERRNGRHWLWLARGQFESPEFETNDIGRLTSADGLNSWLELRYRETEPGPFLRNYSIAVNNSNEWNYGGDRQVGSVGSEVRLTWRNYWATVLSGRLDLRAQDERLTRGGPSMGTPQGWAVTATVENNAAARTRGRLDLDYGRDEDGGLTFDAATEFSVRPGSRWQFSIAPSYRRQVDTQQYVTTRGDGRPETNGRRYVFANIDRSTWATAFRLNFTFKPDLNLDFYAEPFAASGQYRQFGELGAPRDRLLRRYGTDGTSLVPLPGGGYTVVDGDVTFTLDNRDFNIQSFRSNLVLRWEWRPGSTLYVVWQQDRSGLEPQPRRVRVGDMFRSVTAPGDNVLAVKASFWFSID
jgi:hypothetical protein